jgi:hypothetical protein
MDSVIAIALSILAGAYVLWRLTRPFFTADPPLDRAAPESASLLQIETED